MLNLMYEFLQQQFIDLEAKIGFFRWISSLFYIVVDFCESALDLLRLSRLFFYDMPAYLSWMPSVCLPVFLGAIVIAIVFKVLGRT